MSLIQVGKVLERLGIGDSWGLFVASAKCIDYVPFDLDGALVITDVTDDETSLERILEALKARFSVQSTIILAGLDKKNHWLGSKELRLNELVTVGKAYLTSEALQAGSVGQWMLVKLNITNQVDSNEKGVSAFNLQPLVDVVAALRAPEGCPWDRLQTHSTLRRYLLEEVYEVLEAIDNKDMANLREELGDVLLQIVFHARLAEEQGLFTVQDIIDDISAK